MRNKTTYLIAIFVLSLSWTNTVTASIIESPVTYATQVVTDSIPETMERARVTLQEKRLAILANVKKLKSEREAIANKQAREEKERLAKEALAAQKAQEKAAREAARKAESERIAAQKEKERLDKAKAKADREAAQQAAAKRIAAKKEEERLAKEALAAQKAQEKAAKAAAKKEEAERLAAKKAKQAKIKAEVERIAAETEAKRRKKAKIDAQKTTESLASNTSPIVDENPPGVNEKPRATDRKSDPREYVESVSNKKKNTKKKNTKEANNPPPKQETSVVVAEESKTKSAVQKALEKNKKRNKKIVQLPGQDNIKSEDESLLLEDCRFDFNEFDPMTQKVKRGLEKRFFFAYTNEDVKDFFGENDYLVCHGGLVDIQGIIGLNIQFTIDSPYARREYGSIGLNARMLLQLIDGEVLTLICQQSDSGKVSRKTGKTEYTTTFIISPKDERILRKNEILKVRMVWGTGYEEYEVDELDFLIDQFKCIDAARDN